VVDPEAAPAIVEVTAEPSELVKVVTIPAAAPAPAMVEVTAAPAESVKVVSIPAAALAPAMVEVTTVPAELVNVVTMAPAAAGVEVTTVPSDLVKVVACPPAAAPEAEAEGAPVLAPEMAEPLAAALQILLPKVRVGCLSFSGQLSFVQSRTPLRKLSDLQRQEMSLAWQLNCPALLSMLEMQY